MQLLDNNPVSYCPQPSKGIVVKDFLGDPQDDELLMIHDQLLNGLFTELRVIHDVEMIDESVSVETMQPTPSLDITPDSACGHGNNATMETLVGLFQGLRIDDEETEWATVVRDESDPFGAHLDMSCSIVSVLPQEQDDFPPNVEMKVEEACALDDGVVATDVTASKAELANEVRHESDLFGTHDNTCCLFTTVHQEQVQKDDVPKTKWSRFPRISKSNGEPLSRSARLAKKYPRRSPRLAAKHLDANPSSIYY